LRAAHVVHELREVSRVDRQAAVTGVMKLVDEMTEEEKASLVAAIQNSGQSNG
jgi:acetyl-CoA carboxylase/biotin carboxylase 1